jgi:ComF family protein
MRFVALRRAAQVVLDLVYPPRCVLCDRHGAFLCEACLLALPRAEGLRCQTCWLPRNGKTDCWACLERPPAFNNMRSAFRYEGPTRRLVRAYKFDGVSSLAPLLANELAECYRVQGLTADVVVPVPLSGHRKRERGYNQAELLAREVARTLGLPLSVSLRRKRHSDAQARSPNAEQRHQNVTGAFEMGRLGEEVQGQQVLLIDDVATTGATLNACAAVLLSSGAAGVFGLTLARED